jgi:hypothetical protein
VAYFLTPIEKLAASSAMLFKVLKTKRLNISGLNMLTGKQELKGELKSAVEKKELFEYRTMQSSFQITTSLDKEQSLYAFEDKL